MAIDYNRLRQIEQEIANERSGSPQTMKPQVDAPTSAPVEPRTSRLSEMLAEPEQAPEVNTEGLEAKRRLNSLIASRELESKGVPQGNVIQRMLEKRVQKDVERGQDIVETAKGIGTSIVDRGKKLGSELFEAGQGEKLEMSAFGAAPTAVIGSVGDVIGETVIGAGKLLLPQDVENAIKGKTQELGQDVMETELAQNIANKWNELPEETKETLIQAGTVGETLLDMVGVGIGGRVAKQGIESGIDATKVGMRTASEAIDTGKTKVAKLNISDLYKGSKKDAPDLELDVPDVPVKLNEPEINLGFTLKDKKLAQGKGDVTDIYVDEAIRDWTNPDARGVYSIAEERVDSVMKDARKALSDKGSEIGKVRESFINTTAPEEVVENMRKEFDDQLSSIGVEVVDTKKGRKVTQVKGRGTRLDPKEQKLILDMAEQIDEIEADPNLQRILDSRMNIDESINFGKREGYVSNKTQNLAKGVRARMKEGINKVAPTQEKLNNQYIEILEALDAYDKASAKGNNVAYMLDRTFGTRGQKSRDAFRAIEGITGRDLMDEALALRFALKVASPDQKSRLQQAITSAGVDLAGGSAMGVNATMLRAVLDIGTSAIEKGKKMKGIDPRYEDAIKKAEVIKNLDTLRNKSANPPVSPVAESTTTDKAPQRPQETQARSESPSQSQIQENQSSQSIVPETPLKTKEVSPEKTPKASSTTPKDSGKIGEMKIIEEANKMLGDSPKNKPLLNKKSKNLHYFNRFDEYNGETRAFVDYVFSSGGKMRQDTKYVKLEDFISDYVPTTKTKAKQFKAEVNKATKNRTSLFDSSEKITEEIWNKANKQ